MALQAVPLLASITGLLLGFIFITGLTGMQLYSDAYHYSCISDATGNLEHSEVPGMSWGCGGNRACPENFTCTELAESSSLSEDVAGFDNVGAAMLTAFQVSIFVCLAVFLILTFRSCCVLLSPPSDTIDS